jgi:hypothetical protein
LSFRPEKDAQVSPNAVKEEFEELLPEPRCHGLRLVAADSTTVRLPTHLENQAEFGVQLDSAGQP